MFSNEPLNQLDRSRRSNYAQYIFRGHRVAPSMHVAGTDVQIRMRAVPNNMQLPAGYATKGSPIQKKPSGFSP
jgi:hypothetical protein